MPFSSIAYNRGNLVSTAGGILLCEVAQQVELLQTMPVCLALPAASTQGAPFVPTVVACPKVLQDSILCLESQLLFYTRQTWLTPRTAVRCGRLTAEAVVIPGKDAVAALWVLKGSFTLEEREGPIEMTAQSLPLMRSCASAAPGLGTWRVQVAAACLGCTLIFPIGHGAIRRRKPR